MAKNFFQDMIKMKADLRQEMSPKAAVKVEKPTPEEKNWTPPAMESKVRSNADWQEEKVKTNKYYLWVIAVVAVIFLFFAISFFLSDAKISIEPKTQDINLNQNLSASKDAPEGSLSFNLIVLSGEEQKTVQGGEVKDVSVSAKGKAIIYNTFSSAVQRLDINTRLEGSNGKIYKTEKAVTVPGMKGTTPGSVEVNIYGAEAGEAYNSTPLDFKIFGFKGTPKYTKFYGRSQGDIAGGFKGKASLVSDAQKSGAVSELKTKLLSKLREQAMGQIPPGFVLFRDAHFLNIENETISSGSSTQVPVSIKGTFYGFLFNEQDLTKAIVATALKDHDDSDVFISNINDLVFLPLNKDGNADVQNISFNLFGTPKVVWKFDVAKFVGELVGRSKKDFNPILSQYPNIVSADVVLRPFWKFSFPKSAGKIKVMVNYPE